MLSEVAAMSANRRRFLGSTAALGMLPAIAREAVNGHARPRSALEKFSPIVPYPLLVLRDGPRPRLEGNAVVRNAIRVYAAT